MNLLIFGLAQNEDDLNETISKYKNPYSVAHNLFEKTMIQEMENQNIKISHFCIKQFATSLKRFQVVCEKEKNLTKKTKSKTIKYINFPFVKFISLFLSSFCLALKEGKKNNKSIVISTVNYFPISCGVKLATTILGIKNIIIFTDCSSGYAYRSSNRISIKSIYREIIKYTEKWYDGFIFFSSHMNEKINLMNKPWIQMEGFYTPIEAKNEFNKNLNKKIVMYAGTLQKHLGIDMFVNGFKLTNNKNFELWIFGDGDYKPELLNLIKDDQRIKFFGFKTHEEILSYEKKVDLLINTRNPEDEYTWMSFPSKTFEYLASETPFLTTRLKCYPEEYNDFLFFTDYDVKDIAKNINMLLTEDIEKMKDFGKKASEFIKKEKNPKTQTKKIINFLNEVSQ